MQLWTREVEVSQHVSMLVRTTEMPMTLTAPLVGVVDFSSGKL
jgi:hypothetical protein